MADWIRIMMHRDVDLLKTGKIKPSDAYPPAFGAPPQIETRDIKPLPFGYGQGSSTKALWLMEQARKVYNGVSAPPPTPALSCMVRVVWESQLKHPCRFPGHLPMNLRTLVER